MGIFSKIYNRSPNFLKFYVYFYLYWKAKKKLKINNRKRKNLHDLIKNESLGKKCLQIGAREKKIDDHWISVDLFDQSPIIDFHYDIHKLQFEDESFDIVVCNAILEHVEYPETALKELLRV